jgi:hypothetical protein
MEWLGKQNPMHLYLYSKPGQNLKHVQCKSKDMLEMMLKIMILKSI